MYVGTNVCMYVTNVINVINVLNVINICMYVM